MSPWTSLAFSLVLFPSLAAAAPATKIDCPAGTHFVEGRGCIAKIVDKVDCPGGTRFDGKKCVAIVDTSCPDGMRFAEGVGCVAAQPEPKKSKKELAREKKLAEKERKRAEKAKKVEEEKKNGSFSMGFSDRFTSDCQGVPVEIRAGSTFTGGRVMLLVDGNKKDEGKVSVGDSITLKAKHSGKAVELLVKQGMWGTRYKLTVAGTECRLQK